jgi:hypothetical protein
MGTTHVITVNYVVDPVTHKGTVDVAPKVTHVRKDDSLEFKRKDSSAGTMRITFREKELFGTKNPNFSATGRFFKEDGLVSVKGPRAGTTLFDCELLGADDKVLATSTDPNSGGAIEIAGNR